MNDQTEPSTLYEALDAYAQRLVSEHRSVATFQTRQLIVRRLKENHDDLPLDEITLNVCVDMIGHWRDRPTSAITGKQFAASTAQRTLSELIRFFGWLETTNQFEWSAPSHFGQISRRVRRLESDRSVSQREMFTPEHLAILYRHATPTQRLMVCLAMNCGLGAAEMGRLRTSDIILDDDGHFVIDLLPGEGLLRFMRPRTDTYCEWLLWPETVELTQWATTRGEDLDSDLLFVSDSGNPMWKDSSGQPGAGFRHQWQRLLRAVEDQGVPRLPLTAIRNGTAERIRRKHGDVIARMYLGHAAACPSFTAYVRKPFSQLHVALRGLRTELASVFRDDSAS
ncbi:hypothetical protein FYZ48_26085 [Gimesia chilikensis]|uniref:hypothetical protein n=1 Tax=Gimesia chilikensis TaxID=2605989 RepID=UPI0011EE4624|nr:hypothetical protein [Gimesia chilikensis]KAA0131609.1 hypothetical protein FYZ48_26085 [Gimesia chilikensis]